MKYANESFKVLDSTTQFQGFSALKNFGSARAQAGNLRSRSRSIFSRPCIRARAQNFLSAAQFCAHFEILVSFISTTSQEQTVFLSDSCVLE